MQDIAKKARRKQKQTILCLYGASWNLEDNGLQGKLLLYKQLESKQINVIVSI